MQTVDTQKQDVYLYQRTTEHVCISLVEVDAWCDWCSLAAVNIGAIVTGEISAL